MSWLKDTTEAWSSRPRVNDILKDLCECESITEVGKVLELLDDATLTVVARRARQLFHWAGYEALTREVLHRRHDHDKGTYPSYGYATKDSEDETSVESSDSQTSLG